MIKSQRITGKFLAVILILCLSVSNIMPIFAYEIQSDLCSDRGNMSASKDLSGSVSVNEVSIKLVKGQKYKSDFDFGGDNILSKADKKIISVKSGMIIAKNPGSVQLFVKKSGEDIKLNITVFDFELKQSIYNVNVGDIIEPQIQAYQLEYNYYIADRYKEFITITDNGQLKALKAGKAAFDILVNDVRFTAKVQISDPHLSRNSLVIEAGKRKKINLLDCYSKVDWRSADVSVAVVRNGRVKGVSKGKTTINANVNGKELSCIVFVNDCKLTHRLLILKKGDTKRVGISGILNPEYKDIWRQSGKDRGIIQVEENGTITGKKPGSTAVYTEVDGKKYKIKVKVLEQEQTEHTHSYSLLNQTEATSCDEYVESIYKCECGSEYVERDSAGHKYKLLSQEPDEDDEEKNICLRHWINTYSCERCGEIKKERAEGSGHIFDFVESIEASCSEAAYDLMLCRNCQIFEKSFKSTDEYPLKPHELSKMAGQDGDNNILWYCKNCNDSFIENSDGSFSKYEDEVEKKSSSSSSKSTSSSSGKSTSSSSIKSSSSSSSLRPTHTHSLIAENYVNYEGNGTISGYECAICKGRWYQGKIDEESFEVIIYDSNMPVKADTLNGQKKQAYSGDYFMTLTPGKAGFVVPEGYQFAGWSYGETDSQIRIKSNIRVDAKQIEQDPDYKGVLYAKWECIDYKIEYVNTLGTTNPNPVHYSVEDENVVLQNISKPGYDFEGWFDEENNKIDIIDTSLLKYRRITARFNIVKYRISYKTTMDQCPVQEENITEYNVESDELVIKNPAEPLGYRFKGWIGDNIKNPMLNLVIKSGSTGDLCFTATWEKIRYKIMYVLNSGENSLNNPNGYYVDEELILAKPERALYTFGGWYTSYDFAPESRLEKINIGTTGNLLVYAKWIKNSFDYSVRDVVTSYDGRAYGITVSCNTADVKIYYRNKDADNWNLKPVTYKNAGEYETEYRIEKDNFETVYGTAHVHIEKAEGVAIAPTPIKLIYDGNAQKLVYKGFTSTGEMYYSEGMTSVGTYSQEIPVATAAGTYYVWYYSKGDANHYDSPRKSVTISIEKAESIITKVPTPKEVIFNGNSQALVYAGRCEGGEMEYAIGSQRGAPGEYSNRIPTAENAGIYYVYFRCSGDENHKSSPADYVMVEVKKAEAEVLQAPIALENTYNGSPLRLVNEGDARGGGLLYGVVSDKLESVKYSASLPTMTSAGTYYVYYYVKGDSNHNDSTPVYVKVTIKKAAGFVQNGPTPAKLIYNGSEQELVNPGSSITGTMYYRLENGEYSRNLPRGLNAGEYKVYYKSVGDSNHNDSAESSISVTLGTKEMRVSVYDDEIKYTGVKSRGNARVHVSEPGSDYELKYGLTAGNCNLTSVPQYSEIGTYTIYYEVKAKNYTTKNGALIISIVKGDGECTAPRAVTDLAYTGEEQALITEGRSTTGTMYYKLEGQDYFETTLPKALNAGKYRIYYYSEGNSNYNSTSIKYIDVEMAKAKLEVTFTNTSFEYDGLCHYPTVNVTSKAKLPDYLQIYVAYRLSDNETWKYIGYSSTINGSIFESLPIEWVPQKKEGAVLDSNAENKDIGTYKISYCVRAMVKVGMISTVSNFEQTVTDCTYEIRW